MALDLSGTLQYLEVADGGPTDITGTALTVSVWLNRDTTPGAGSFPGIIVKGGDITNQTIRQYTLYLNQNDAKPVFDAGDSGGADTVIAGAAPALNTWEHVAGRKDGTGASALAVFLNGSKTTGSSNRSMQNLSGNLFFGTWAVGGNAFDGKLAEVAIWDAALSDDEIASLAKGFSALLVRPQSLQGYWPIIGNASPEPDLRNGNNATLTGSPTAFPHPRILKPRPAIYVP